MAPLRDPFRRRHTWCVDVTSMFTCFFARTFPGDAVLPHLLDWVRFHFPRHERNAASMLTEDTFGLENHPEYWDTVLGSLLKGRIEVVRRLLKMHSASDSVPFRMGSDVLKSMPVYNVRFCSVL